MTKKDVITKTSKEQDKAKLIIYKNWLNLMNNKIINLKSYKDLVNIIIFINCEFSKLPKEIQDLSKDEKDINIDLHLITAIDNRTANNYKILFHNISINYPLAISHIESSIEFNNVNFTSKFALRNSLQNRKNEIDFISCNFYDNTDITGSNNISIQHCNFKKYAGIHSLTQSKISKNIFNDTILGGDLSLSTIKNCTFIGRIRANISRFQGMIFFNNKFKRSTFNYIQDISIKELDSLKSFRHLRELMKNEGNEREALYFQSLVIKERQKILNFSMIGEKIIGILYGLSNGYGWSISRPFITLIISFFLFGYLFMQGNAYANLIEINKLEYSWYEALKPPSKSAYFLSLQNIFLPIKLTINSNLILFSKENYLYQLLSYFQIFFSAIVWTLLIITIRKRFKIKE